MNQTFNVYCDESCHLEHDGQGVMVLGAVWCPLVKSREIADRLRDIRERHDLPSYLEIKWTKVSPAQQQFYLDLVDYFFDDDDLHFRAIIIPDKSILCHEKFHQTHDDWYYKMYFLMLQSILDPQSNYRIYLDIKDTRSAEKVRELREVLNRANVDFNPKIIDWMQNVHSRNVPIIQLADLLIGAVGYKNRGLEGSETKLRLLRRISERSGYDLTRSTLLRESKFNLLVWRPRERQEYSL